MSYDRDSVDFKAMDAKQRTDWAVLGIIPGPVYDNHNNCPKEDYVATFEWFCPKAMTHYANDLYLTAGWHGHTVIIRCSNRDSDFHAASLFMAFGFRGSPYSEAMKILYAKGSFFWKKDGDQNQSQPQEVNDASV